MDYKKSQNTINRYLNDSVLFDRNEKVISISDFVLKKRDMKKYEDAIFFLGDIEKFIVSVQTIQRHIRQGFFRGMINDGHIQKETGESVIYDPTGYEIKFRLSDGDVVVKFSEIKDNSAKVLIVPQKGKMEGLNKVLRRFISMADDPSLQICLTCSSENKSFLFNFDEIKKQLFCSTKNDTEKTKKDVQALKIQRVDNHEELDAIKKISAALMAQSVTQSAANRSPVIIKSDQPNSETRFKIMEFNQDNDVLSFYLSSDSFFQNGQNPESSFSNLKTKRMSISPKFYSLIDSVEKMLGYADMNDFKKLMLQNIISRQNLRSKI